MALKGAIEEGHSEQQIETMVVESWTDYTYVHVPPNFTGKGQSIAMS